VLKTARALKYRGSEVHLEKSKAQHKSLAKKKSFRKEHSTAQEQKQKSKGQHKKQKIII